MAIICPSSAKLGCDKAQVANIVASRSTVSVHAHDDMAIRQVFSGRITLFAFVIDGLFAVLVIKVDQHCAYTASFYPDLSDLRPCELDS